MAASTCTSEASASCFGCQITPVYRSGGGFADGQNRVLFGGEPKMDYGSSQVYIQAQQMVYRPDASDRGLTVFGGANWTTSGQPNVERMVFGGAYYKGAFAPRPNDTLGVAVSLVNVNPRVTERVNSVLPNPLAPGEPVGDLLRGERHPQTILAFYFEQQALTPEWGARCGCEFR